MRIQKLLFAATALAVMTISVPAMALPLSVGGTVNVGDANGNPFTPSSDPGGFASGVSFRLNPSSTTVNASAGLFVLNYQNVTPTDSTWTQFLSFCLEPDVYLRSSSGAFSNPYTVQAVGGAGNLYTDPNGYISELWARHRSEVVNDETAAAFQVALWELAYRNTDLSLATGDFSLVSTGGVYNTAQGWLTSLTGNGPRAAGLVVLVDNPNDGYYRQDLITQVPEPATLGLLGLGLLGIGFARRRRAAA